MASKIIPKDVSRQIHSQLSITRISVHIAIPIKRAVKLTERINTNDTLFTGQT